MSSVALTMMTPTALGRMCRKMIRRSLAPATRAASTNSRSRSVRNSPRTSRAIAGPGEQAEDDAEHGGAEAAEGAAEHRADDDQRDGDDDVGEAHQHRVGPPR